VAELTERYKPAAAVNPELVLKLAPDLVLTSSETTTDITEILRAGRVPVFQVFTRFRTLDEIANTILLTGFLSGEDARAREAHSTFTAAVERARKRKPAGVKPPRVLGLGGNYSYGDETLFHDVLRVLGAVNVAGENGLHGYDAVSRELTLRWDPEWIVTGADSGKQAEAVRRITSDPVMALTTAARKGQVVALDNRVFLPMSPFTALLLDELGRALYPEQR
jgi:iron complex transport system substrate-binding protein